MAGKVNPVIPEAINQIAFQIMGNDMTITMAAQSGQLELNAFLPVIAHNLFEILDILRNGIELFIHKCIKGIKANRERCREMVEESYVQAPALIRHIGYNEASSLAKECVAENKSLRTVILEKKIMDSKTIDRILNPLELTKPGIPGIEKE